MSQLHTQLHTQLHEQIYQSIDNHINDFIQKLATSFQISKDDVRKIWESLGEPVAPKHVKAPLKVVTSQVLTHSTELSSMSKTELVEHCKLKNFKVSGSKADLIARLTGEAHIIKENPTILKKKSEVSTIPSVIKSILKPIAVSTKISRNEFGNYVHADTSFVFDKDLKIFHGKQYTEKIGDREIAKILPLSQEDIELCKQYNFPYVIPKTMIGKKENNLTELDEEEDVEEEEGEEEGEEIEEEGEEN